MKKIAFWGAALLLLAACQKPQGFDYRDMRNLQVSKLGFDRSMISMDLVYFNPNNFGVNLKHVDCDVYVNHTFLGKYTLDTLLHIDRKSEFVLPSHMEVNMQSVFKNALMAFFSSDVLLTVKGNTRVGKAGIYISMPFEYEARHPMDLFGSSSAVPLPNH